MEEAGYEASRLYSDRHLWRLLLSRCVAAGNIYSESSGYLRRTDIMGKGNHPHLDRHCNPTLYSSSIRSC